MRLIKMFGLAAVAAVAAMAFVGASSAMAGNTQLCKFHEEPCNNPVTSLHMVNVGDPVLLGEFLGIHNEILCKKSLGEATVLGLASPQVAHATALTWEECHTASKKPCTVTTVKLGLFDILRTALNLGTATSLAFEVNVACEGLPECVYGGSPTFVLEGALHQEATGHGMLTGTKVTVTRISGKFGCPAFSQWTALYEPLEHVYVMT